MAKAGWDLVQATDVSQRERDKDTLFFEYTESLSEHGSSSCSASMASSRGPPVMPGVGTSRSGSMRIGSSSGAGVGSGSVLRDGYGEDGLREVELFAVSFNRSDRIRVISQQPPQVASRMMELIKQAVASQWKYGIQAEQDYCGAAEIKLQGNPFNAKRSEAIYARMLLAQMIANFKVEGYKLYASLSLGEGKDGRDVESWVLRRMNASWQ
ncbi:hypothetical protein BGX34_006788 [Mortierella sp. NVP85]|nr:hypothetical protein BGX34_006788 [Mortierella sp. NVP85]